MGFFLVLYSLLFYLWFMCGKKPTARISTTYRRDGFREFLCTFDILGKINPEEQQKFEDGQSANQPLVKMLQKDIEKAKKTKTSVKNVITAYTFKNEDQYANLVLKAGVFYTNDRLFDPNDQTKLNITNIDKDLQ